jgi:Family of unknown function (DUF6157)
VELIIDTFVLVAPDCPALAGTVPKTRASGPTVAGLQHELLNANPYQLTLEDLMLAVHLRREGLSPETADAQSDEIHTLLFGKPYPCMRASPLPKTYGWGVHHDHQGRICLFGVDSEEYKRFAKGGLGIEVVAAMRNKRA